MPELDKCFANALGIVDTIVFDIHVRLSGEYWLHTSCPGQAMAHSSLTK